MYRTLASSYVDYVEEYLNKEFKPYVDKLDEIRSIYINEFNTVSQSVGGGNQGDLQYAYDNQYVDNILSQVFPNATGEEKEALLWHANSSGCGNVAIANLVFKKFEGKEEEFYNTFGYPMYDIKNNREFSLVTDYNYEPMIGISQIDDTRSIVSSWGEKFVLEISTDREQGDYYYNIFE